MFADGPEVSWNRVSPAADPPPFAVVRATYDVGRWIVVIVRPNRRDRGSTATAFEVFAPAFPSAKTLWAVIAARAQAHGMVLGTHGPELVSTNGAIREWAHVTID